MNPTMNHELEQRKEVNPIKDLHNDLTYHYNCGRLKNFNTRVVIETLLKKL
jgi:hypothetical protein